MKMKKILPAATAAFLLTAASAFAQGAAAPGGDNQQSPAAGQQSPAGGPGGCSPGMANCPSDQGAANQPAPGGNGQQAETNHQPAGGNGQQADTNKQPSAGGNMGAAASIDVSPDKQSQVRKIIVAEKTEPVHVNFNIAVGSVVPATVNLNACPAEVISLVPDFSAGCEYIVLADGRIAIVRPDTRLIVLVMAG